MNTTNYKTSGYDTSTKAAARVIESSKENNLEKRLSFSGLLNYEPNAKGDWLIGKGFLSRGGSVLIQGEPGAGKSKLTQHLAFSLALGIPFLGLVPHAAYRVLYIQAEDTEDDLHESAKGFWAQMGLSKMEVEQMDANLRIVSLHGVSGDNFVRKLKELAEAHKAQIVVTDPLLAFVGCDLTNQTAMTSILREGIGSYLREKSCGWICVHHSAKGAKGAGASKVTKGLGSIEISAFFRGVIDLERTKSDAEALVMEIAKRSRQANLLAFDGTPTRSQVIRMGKDYVSWEVDGTVVTKVPRGKSGRPTRVNPADVEAFVKEQQLTGMPQSEIFRGVADRFGYSEKQARRLVDKFTPVESRD